MRLAIAGKAGSRHFALGRVVPWAVVVAIVLSFGLAIGALNAVLFLGTAAWPSVLVWTFCWLPADTRGKVGFTWVLMASIATAGLATTAWLSHYRIDLAKVDLSVPTKLLPLPEHWVFDCVVLSSTAGAIIGAVTSRVAFGARNRVNVTPNAGQPQSPPNGGSRCA